MATLLLLNGPPGVGKSTIADALVGCRPGWVAVSVDEVKHALPTWPADPIGAGLEARVIAVRRIGKQLERGHDVVVDQYLAREDFVVDLGRVAREHDARFVEVLLTVDESTLAQRLRERRAHPNRPEQTENDRFLAPEDAASLITSLAVRRARPGIHPVDASGTLETTVRALDDMLER